MDWYELGRLLVEIFAVIGVWTHVSPWIKNASNSPWLDALLAFGNGIAGEYQHNRSAE